MAVFYSNSLNEDVLDTECFSDFCKDNEVIMLTYKESKNVRNFLSLDYESNTKRDIDFKKLRKIFCGKETT